MGAFGKSKLDSIRLKTERLTAKFKLIFRGTPA
jgi:hypothetical protein